jgi:hypothetical protein
VPRHDRAHGVYQQPGRAGGSTTRKTRGKKNTYAAKQGRRSPIAAPIAVPGVEDMPRNGGNTPKPNAPKPQHPKPNPKAPKRESD